MMKTTWQMNVMGELMEELPEVCSEERNKLDTRDDHCNSEEEMMMADQDWMITAF
jgi:hypothetical protein